MPLSKKAYVVIFLAGGAGLLLLAGTANAKSATKPGTKPGDAPPGTKPGEGEITVQPPGAGGLPDGTVPPVTVHTDEDGNVTGVTVPAEQPGAGSGSGQPPAGSVVTTIPGPPVPSPAPDITNQPPSPIAAQEVQPQNDPNGTVMLARILLARETAPDWKGDFGPEVALWQKQVGLKNDGKFGPKALERMAAEVGVLPLVRYWSQPVYNKATAMKATADIVARAIAKLTPLLPDSEYHIAALKAGLGREQGQALAKNPAPARTLEEVQAIIAQLDKKAVSDGKKVVS